MKGAEQLAFVAFHGRCDPAWALAPTRTVGQGLSGIHPGLKCWCVVPFVCARQEQGYWGPVTSSAQNRGGCPSWPCPVCWRCHGVLRDGEGGRRAARSPAASVLVSSQDGSWVLVAPLSRVRGPLSPGAWGGAAFLGLDLVVPSGASDQHLLLGQPGRLASSS